MLLEKKIVDIFKSRVLVRFDDTGTVYYYSAADFEGLCSTPYTFIGNRGQKLVGSFYYYGAIKTDRIVIFEHGMGGGHLSYMKEIECLASHGYTVLAYDHTGCMQSEGENIGGFSQSLADLDCLIKSLKSDGNYKSTSFSVVGHSWGAFSTLNISALHPQITHVVAISGFISVRSILKQFFSGIMSLYVPALIRIEQENNPKYANLDARKTLNTSRAHAMIIHSADDKTVSYKKNFLKLKKALRNRDNALFITLSGREIGRAHV